MVIGALDVQLILALRAIRTTYYVASIALIDVFEAVMPRLA